METAIKRPNQADIKVQIVSENPPDPEVLAQYARLKKAHPPDPKHRRLNFGGGNWYFPHWEVADAYAPKELTDYRVDFRDKNRVELPDNSTQLAYSSHLLEHLSDDEAMHLITETHRLLHRGGIFRIVVPDADKAVFAYCSGWNEFFEDGGVKCTGDNPEHKLLNFFASYATIDPDTRQTYQGGPRPSPELVRKQISNLDLYSFVNWAVSLIPSNAPYTAHVNGYDYCKLQAMLQRAGFEMIVRSDYQQSRAPEMRSTQFDNRPMVSLYVEAIKTA